MSARHFLEPWCGGVMVAVPIGWAQAPAADAKTASVEGAACNDLRWRNGTIRGHVKSGTVPLPGVTVMAQNTLTGKRYSTTRT